MLVSASRTLQTEQSKLHNWFNSVEFIVYLDATVCIPGRVDNTEDSKTVTVAELVIPSIVLQKNKDKINCAVIFRYHKIKEDM